MSEDFRWSRDGREIVVACDRLGPTDRPAVLMLPAMSTVSTRAEMLPLAEALGDSRQRVLVDWPGFGDGERPPLDYTPELYRAFLEAFVVHMAERPAVVAAGHAAAYALDLEARKPGTFSHLALIAPTWRGPLPTVMGGRKPIQARIRRLVQAPVIGEAIYRLNVSRPVVRRMYKGHVFADADRVVTPAFLDAKMKVARRPNARFASACFVTGALDPMTDRAAFLDAARAVTAPITLIYGPDVPPRSRAEMEALAALANIETHVLERGALGMHEEMPAAVAPLIRDFLDSRTAAKQRAPAPESD